MSNNSIKRPTGITILAWLYLISSGFWLLLGPYMTIYKKVNFNFEEIIVLIVISMINIVISLGLFKGKKWSWFLGVFPLVFVIFDVLISYFVITVIHLLEGIKLSILNGEMTLYPINKFLTLFFIYFIYILLTSLFSSRVIEYFSFTALSKVNDLRLFLYLLLAWFVIEIIIKLFFLIL